MLSNPFYIGIIRIRGESYEGAHEPIISPTLFNQVQEVLSGKTHRKGQKHEFLFRQLFTCAFHGRSLVAEHHKGHTYYRCHAKGCACSIMREELLESAVIHELKCLEFSQEEKDYFRTKLAGMQQNWQTERQQVTAGLELRLAQLKERQDRLMDAFLDQTIDKEAFQERKTALLQERCLLKNKLEGLMQGNKSLPERLNELLELAGSAYLAYNAAMPAEKRELIKLLSSNRTLQGKSLTIMLKNPFKLVAERGKVFDGCPRRATGLDVVTGWDMLIPKLIGSFSLCQ